MDTPRANIVFSIWFWDLQCIHVPPAMDTRADRRGACRMCRLQRGLSALPSMEPWPLSHGYGEGGPEIYCGATNLQWSHDLSAMDTRYRFSDSVVYACPSMYPWPLSHGYMVSVDQFAKILVGPSMEPWPPSHGYDHDVVRVSIPRRPSMEP